jgi:PAS domain S-box-containing protein
MKIYPDKIKFFIKQSGMTNKVICERANISRTSLYEWCNKIKTPTESNLRKLAKIIFAPIEEISDLPADPLTSKENLSASATSWLELSQKAQHSQSSEFTHLIECATKMEKKLNEASLIFQGIIKTTDTILYIKDINSKYIITSRAFLDNLSLPSNYNVEGKEDSDFFSVNDAKKNSIEDKSILQYGKKIIKKEDFIPGSKHRKWGLITKLPIYDNENKIQGVLGRYIDITEKKKNEQLREILEVGISEFSEVFTIMDNKTGERLYTNANADNPEHNYMNPSKYNTKNFMSRINVIHPDDRKKIIEHHKYKNWPKKFTFRVISTDKETRWIGATYKTVEYLGKSCTAAIYKDITAKAKVEEFKTLFDSSIDLAEDLISILDKKDNSFLYVNEKFKDMFGIDKDVFYKKGLKYIVNNFIHADSRDDFIKNYTNINLKKKKIYKYLSKDKSIRWVETNSKVINYKNRECIITVSRDITSIIYILEQHSLLTEMADHTHDTIIWIGRLINNKAKTIHVSKNFSKLTGYNENDIKASILSPESRKRLTKFLLKKSKNLHLTLQIQCRNKTVINLTAQLYRKNTFDNKVLISAILKKTDD